MSQMLRRPPAKLLARAPVEASGRVSGSTAGAIADQASDRFETRDGRPFEYRWQDFLQINPVREPPQLTPASTFGPYVRTGQLRRWSRTFMTAGPRFLGRVALVGSQQRLFADRARMSGVPTRPGTYVYPRSGYKPRTVKLG